MSKKPTRREKREGREAKHADAIYRIADSFFRQQKPMDADIAQALADAGDSLYLTNKSELQ